MRTPLFWAIRQRVVAIPYRRFGTPVGPIFRGQEFSLKKITSVSLFYSTCNIFFSRGFLPIMSGYKFLLKAISLIVMSDPGPASE